MRAQAQAEPPIAPSPFSWPASTAQPSEPVLLHSTDPTDAAIESVWFAGESREAGGFLITRGMSARLAEDLIGEARTHDLPFSGAGGMRDALCACVARRLPRHRGLPRGGALIAVVGGGGSGKTRCAAAIAASYQGASALEVRAVVLGRYDSGAELSSLIESLGVSVQTAERGSRAAVEVAAARSGVLVVADTPTVSPADPAGIGILAVELAALAPEEVLVTLPATSNATAARQMLAALAPLTPSGIIVTHADETDQLGTAVELSLESGLPLVYIHDGLELPGALAPADPAGIAERLLA
jgi:flagellar biosynthesis GTPase FlhF